MTASIAPAVTAVALRHAGIVVRSMERALRFYRDLLGLRVVWDRLEHGPPLEDVLGIPDVRVRTVKLAPAQHRDEAIATFTAGQPHAPPALLELLEFESPRSCAPSLDAADPREIEQSRALQRLGLTHLAWTVAGLDALFLRLSAAGVRFIHPPRTSADGRVKLAFCIDPDGTPMELVEVVVE